MVLIKNRLLQICAVMAFLTINIIIAAARIEVPEPIAAPVIEEIPEEEPVILETMSLEDTIELAHQNYCKKYEELVAKVYGADNPEDRMYDFIQYKVFIDEYSYLVDPPEDLEFCFDDDDLQILYSVVEGETRGTDFDSKVNVANVIFNRFVSNDWPDDLGDVLTQSGQFAGYCSNVEPSTILACEYAWIFPTDDTEGATFFNSGAAMSRWSGADYVMTDAAGHSYYSKEEH